MKNILIVDSSSLILLAKCSLLEILAERFRLIIPGGVSQEVVNKETVERFPDAMCIHRLIEGESIEVRKVELKGESLPLFVGRGEREAIVLAKEIAGAILLTDDGKAIKVCKYLNIPFIISPKVVTELYRLDQVDLGRARKAIRKLGLIGRYSPDIIADALLSLEEAKKRC